MKIRNRFLVLTLLGGAIVFAQSPKPFTMPRMSDGHPDLQGTYDLATVTPIERPAGQKATLTKEEAAKLEQEIASRNAASQQSISGDRKAPPKGGDGSAGPAGNVGGYNTFWLDPGSTYTVVDGQKRTSLVIDPPDGRVPPMKPEARRRALALIARPTSDAQESNDPRGRGSVDR